MRIPTVNIGQPGARRRSAVGMLALCLLVGACAEGQEMSEETEERMPNIVYIVSDDAGYGDFSVYGQDKFATPAIDRMAEEGIRFTQHYSGSTVCAPSRSVLMTGLHSGHTYIRGNKEVQPEGQEPLPDSIHTMAEMLQDAGYTTGAFGKWGLGFPGSEGDPLNQGFDHFFGYNCQRQAHNYYPYYLWDDDSMLELPGNSRDGTEVYAPDLIHARTMRFIEENRDRPFFLFIPSIIPHAELLVPEDSVFQRFRRRFDEPNAFEGVDFGDPGYRSGAYGSQEAPRAAFAAMMTRLDRQVGDVLQKLDELGLRENTIVMFTSDNGPHVEAGADPEFFNSTGPLRGVKRDLYEGGIRVPMIVRWPGTIPAGTTTDHVSAFWDVMPTLADVTGAGLPERVDGISFLPTLLGESAEQAVHDYLYWEFHERGGRRAVRKNNWKAVQYDVGPNPDAPLELYDLEADVGESYDVAGQHPEIVRDMLQIMDDAHTPSPLFNFGR